MAVHLEDEACADFLDKALQPDVVCAAACGRFKLLRRVVVGRTQGLQLLGIAVFYDLCLGRHLPERDGVADMQRGGS